MNEKAAQVILNALKSGKASRARESLKTLRKMLFIHYDEKWGNIKGNETTETLKFLHNKFIDLCNSENPKLCYAGLRGLNAVVFSDIFEEKTPETLDILFKTLLDENGNIRFITANIIGHIRPTEIMGQKGKFTESMYVDLYLALQEMYDAQKDRKKKKSIEHALEKLSCPYL